MKRKLKRLTVFNFATAKKWWDDERNKEKHVRSFNVQTDLEDDGVRLDMCLDLETLLTDRAVCVFANDKRSLYLHKGYEWHFIYKADYRRSNCAKLSDWILIRVVKEGKRACKKQLKGLFV